jgi:hypothetical protein
LLCVLLYRRVPDGSNASQSEDQYSLSEPAAAALADSSSSVPRSDVVKSNSSCNALAAEGCQLEVSTVSTAITICVIDGVDSGAAGFRLFLRTTGLRAGFRALFAVVFFATAVLAIAFRAFGLADFVFAFALGLDLVFAETLEVARFAVFFAADFADFFAADFIAFFFPAGFAISEASPYCFCTRFHVIARVLSYIPPLFSTTINAVKRNSGRLTAILQILLALSASCSRLTTLTPSILADAQAKWDASRPSSYYLRIEMKGDRVEKEQFETVVRNGQVESFKRNGQDIHPSPDQDYSMDGLFRILRQEMALVQKPTLLGAPEGYGAYPMASFDQTTGRLTQYRRTVGGTSNTIEIRVLEFRTI